MGYSNVCSGIGDIMNRKVRREDLERRRQNISHSLYNAEVSVRRERTKTTYQDTNILIRIKICSSDITDCGENLDQPENRRTYP